MIKICHASIDENGHAQGGVVGDQTGKEVCVRNWYNKPWEYMLRYPNESVAYSAANTAEILANSNLVGYDQTERNSLHEALKQRAYNIGRYCFDNIKTETDCSAFVTACYIAAGVKELEYTGNAPTTRTMKKAFTAAGFELFEGSKYTASDVYLRKGDILVKSGSHTVMAIETGARYGKPDTDFTYFDRYSGNSNSIVDGLRALGVDSSPAYRRKIAEANRILDYRGTAEQNSKMLQLLKDGYLLIP